MNYLPWFGRDASSERGPTHYFIAVAPEHNKTLEDFQHKFVSSLSTSPIEI
jgi:hypothetical protein